MPKATSVNITPQTFTSEFLIAVNRVRLSQIIRDAYVADAFRRAEDDGLSPEPVEADHPKTLDGGAAEIVPAGGRRAFADMEG